MGRSPKPRITGRPPSGIRSGERVRDYPQVTLRLPPETKAKLNALTVVTGTPQWRVVNAALECFFRERTSTEQKQVISAIAKELSSRAHGNKP